MGEKGAMANITTPIPDIVARTRSVQDHIDELPIWADGTKLPSAPMTGMQWLIWSLAAAGKFFEGYVVFMSRCRFFRASSKSAPSSMASSARQACLAYSSAQSPLADCQIVSAASRCSSPR
jgi:hypothetical protein